MFFYLYFFLLAIIATRQKTLVKKQDNLINLLELFVCKKAKYLNLYVVFFFFARERNKIFNKRITFFFFDFRFFISSVLRCIYYKVLNT